MPRAKEKKELEVFNSQVKIGKSRTEALGVHYSPPRGKVSRFVKPRLHMDCGPMRTNMPILSPVGSSVIYRKGKEELLAKVAEYRNEVCKAVIIVNGEKRVVGQERISPVIA
jgi:hypothetical protein